jgi:hypothetical protein
MMRPPLPPLGPLQVIDVSPPTFMQLLATILPPPVKVRLPSTTQLGVDAAADEIVVTDVPPTTEITLEDAVPAQVIAFVTVNVVVEVGSFTTIGAVKFHVAIVGVVAVKESSYELLPVLANVTVL